MSKRKTFGLPHASNSPLVNTTLTLSLSSTQVRKECQSATSLAVKKYFLTSSTRTWSVHIGTMDPTRDKVLSLLRRSSSLPLMLYSSRTGARWLNFIWSLSTSVRARCLSKDTLISKYTSTNWSLSPDRWSQERNQGSPKSNCTSKHREFLMNSQKGCLCRAARTISTVARRRTHVTSVSSPCYSEWVILLWCDKYSTREKTVHWSIGSKIWSGCVSQRSAFEKYQQRKNLLFTHF